MLRKTVLIVVAVLCLVGGLWATQGRIPQAPTGRAAVPQEVAKATLKAEAKEDPQPALRKPAPEAAFGKVPETAQKKPEKHPVRAQAALPRRQEQQQEFAAKASSSASGSAAQPFASLSGSVGGNTVGMGSVGTRGRGGIGIGSAGGLGALGGGGGISNAGVAYGHGSAVASGLASKGKKVIVLNDILVSGKDETSSGDSYKNHGINPFTATRTDRLSTFSVDVDTASYTLARRELMEGVMPPVDSVRVEEFLNYFRYDYPPPTDHPLAVSMDAAPSPYTPGRHLLRVGVQGKRLSVSERKTAHLTFLVDVSGSMQSPDRLPLAKRALRMLVDNLRDGDTVALVTYAGGVKLVLPPTGLEKKALIHAAIEDLTPGGSTAMSSGIELAYKQAMATLDGHSVSRVLILSDGDANVGRTSHEEILQQIRGYVKEGVTLSTLGFGLGNYKDTLMEQLADRGNGNYFYVDSLMAARRIFQEQLGGTLEVIAQDVKLQVEFDPAQVERYRLVGYENRNIADEDFRNDKVDAGEIGAGHSVTALYELELAPGATGDHLATVHLRAKKPRGETADEAAYPFQASALSSRFEDASSDFRFATAVMGAAEIFRRSPHAQKWNFEQVVRIAQGASPKGNAERQEFVALLQRAHEIKGLIAGR